MSSIVSKWVVLQTHDVGADDCDASGVLRDEVLARWIDEARLAYLECCPVLRDASAHAGRVVRCDIGVVPPGAQFGAPETIAISAGATEFFPTSFTLAFRLRSLGSAGDVVVNLSCSVSLVDPATDEPGELGDDVRDEQIALAHAARHFN